MQPLVLDTRRKLDLIIADFNMEHRLRAPNLRSLLEISVVVGARAVCVVVDAEKILTPSLIGSAHHGNYGSLAL